MTGPRMTRGPLLGWREGRDAAERMQQRRHSAGLSREQLAELQEVRRMVQDKADRRHWSRECWCRAGRNSPGTGHVSAAGGLVVVPPPWDEARRGEQAR